MPSNPRVQIRRGWHQAGRCGVTLGDPVDAGQPWTPVLFDDDEDPTFHKSVGLEPERDRDEAIIADLRNTGSYGVLPKQAADRLVQLLTEVGQLESIIQHCWVHSGHVDCGSDQMDSEMRVLYRSIAEREPE